MGLEQHNDVIYHLKGQFTYKWNHENCHHFLTLSFFLLMKTKINCDKCVTKQLLVTIDTYNMFFHTVDVNGDQQLEGE